jgi:hypothetical protein
MILLHLFLRCHRLRMYPANTVGAQLGSMMLAQKLKV